MKVKNKIRWIRLNEDTLSEFYVYAALTDVDIYETLDHYMHSLHPNHNVLTDYKFYSKKRKGIIYPIKKLNK